MENELINFFEGYFKNNKIESEKTFLGSLIYRLENEFAKSKGMSLSRHYDSDYARIFYSVFKKTFVQVFGKEEMSLMIKANKRITIK